MLDIPSVTLRAWESRYEAVMFLRMESGYRMYTEENLQDFKWLTTARREWSEFISRMFEC